MMGRPQLRNSPTSLASIITMPSSFRMMEADSPQKPPPTAVTYEIRLPEYRHPGEPEHYRLAASRAGANRELESRTTTPVLTFRSNKDFWFRTRYISAIAIALSHLHPHTLELQIRPSTVASLIESCVNFLSGFIQSWAQAAFPEWFLPARVVLKQQKVGEEEMIMAELFDTELKAYGLLKPLQGVVVPTCFGQLHYHGTRALLLGYLGGVSLSSPEGATLRLEELSALLQPCYRALHAFGVHHDDPNLSNFQLVNDGKIMVLDLENAVFGLSADDQAFFLKTSVEHLAGRDRSMQAYYRNDGSLEAA
ncbi:uncharacterized protein B0H64DRAFT_143552 [Chaetomium fimeti]|uniref:Uncharacterized protein n=1 Tax=Chaetomium fimeti TaxID=1854472 RepID=A0AAE0HEW8_9PEZI|nr:hypothetical protein B0H64DRAFT_143552 [Chaetomium fimeti]